jgi:hypothetical protein
VAAARGRAGAAGATCAPAENEKPNVLAASTTVDARSIRNREIKRGRGGPPRRAATRAGALAYRCAPQTHPSQRPGSVCIFSKTKPEKKSGQRASEGRAASIFISLKLDNQAKVRQETNKFGK